MSELAFLTRILQRAITTDQLPPESPGIVELGDEVAVEFANGYTQRFLVASPGDLDRQAAWTIQRLLTGDGPAGAGPGRLGARTWSIPAKAYWLSGPDNYHRQAARRPDHPGPSHSVEPAASVPATPVASPPGPASNQVAGDHRPGHSLHRPRHGRPFRFKQRLGAGAGQGGNATHEDHGRL